MCEEHGREGSGELGKKPVLPPAEGVLQSKRHSLSDLFWAVALLCSSAPFDDVFLLPSCLYQSNNSPKTSKRIRSEIPVDPITRKMGEEDGSLKWGRRTAVLNGEGGRQF
jgi:hypothetical protein